MNKLGDGIQEFNNNICFPNLILMIFFSMIIKQDFGVNLCCCSLRVSVKCQIRARLNNQFLLMRFEISLLRLFKLISLTDDEEKNTEKNIPKVENDLVPGDFYF